ncbi:MAG TPA: hypothetical protein VMF69_07030 [Gemmataceae bacterium]|nr:hypothetical protein [Gemmataceae bacterium]
MLVLSNRARETNALSVSFSQFTQMVDRRLSISQKGLAEARQHLAAGQAEDAEVVLEKIEEDLFLLRRRLSCEVKTAAPRSSVLHDCAN